MEIKARLVVKLDDEQLDKIVIDHCNEAIQDCLTLQDDEYVQALRKVVEYFGGEPLYTSTSN